MLCLPRARNRTWPTRGKDSHAFRSDARAPSGTSIDQTGRTPRLSILSVTQRPSRQPDTAHERGSLAVALFTHRAANRQRDP